jgi:uncharacterized protein DUF397
MPIIWRKSSYSSNGSNCVEVAGTPDATLARDSKNPTGPTLRFAQSSWAGFLARTKADAFTR